MTKTSRTIVALCFLFALSGCGLVSVNHPTTESRYMSAAEQDFWTDTQGRQDKSREWSDELARQSAVRMDRYLGR